MYVYIYIYYGDNQFEPRFSPFFILRALRGIVYQMRRIVRCFRKRECGEIIWQCPISNRLSMHGCLHVHLRPSQRSSALQLGAIGTSCRDVAGPKVNIGGERKRTDGYRNSQISKGIGSDAKGVQSFAPKSTRRR